MTKKTAKATRKMPTHICSRCQRSISNNGFARQSHERACQKRLGKPQVIYAPGHFSAGSLERPEPRL